jgi:hypothetical protein
MHCKERKVNITMLNAPSIRHVRIPSIRKRVVYAMADISP